MSVAAKARERRVVRRLETRGLRGLGQALVRLRGVRFGDRWELGSILAVGAEGAVFLCYDVNDATAPVRVAKVALLPYHKPFNLSFQEVRLRRDRMREEATFLATSASPYMPQFLGLHEFANPLLDAGRGGEFAKPEPVFVMERLPGFDLDYWLARVHSSRVPRAIVRRNVDHVAVVLLRGLWDLHERGYFFCDLRPGNIRIRGRSEHRIRLMDAGSLVPRDDRTGGFPHVPAYLPPDLFLKAEEEGPDVLVPSLAIQAVMAGRTLFEVATGRVPVPGEPVDTALLKADTVSPEIADTIDGLCTGSFSDVFTGLKYLAKRTDRGRTTSQRTRRETAAAPAAQAPVPVAKPTAPPADVRPAAAARSTVVQPAEKPAAHRTAAERSKPQAPAPASRFAPAAQVRATAPRDLASVLAAARAGQTTGARAARPPLLVAFAAAAAAEAAPSRTAVVESAPTGEGGSGSGEGGSGGEPPRRSKPKDDMDCTMAAHWVDEDTLPPLPEPGPRTEPLEFVAPPRPEPAAPSRPPAPRTERPQPARSERPAPAPAPVPTVDPLDFLDVQMDTPEPSPPQDDDILPPPPPRRSLWQRFLEALRLR